MSACVANDALSDRAGLRRQAHREQISLRATVSSSPPVAGIASSITQRDSLERAAAAPRATSRGAVCERRARQRVPKRRASREGSDVTIGSPTLRRACLRE